MNRVQKSLSDLSVDGNRRRKPQHHVSPPAVPDAEFDFSKGNEKFQKERQAMKAAATEKDEDDGEDTVELGEPESAPHPSVVAQQEEVPKAERKAASYNKSSFFDNISSDSSRVSRADERHRNLDTFGEAGGAQYGGGYGGHRGGHSGHRGRGRGRRGGGGYGQQREFVHYDLNN